MHDPSRTKGWLERRGEGHPIKPVGPARPPDAPQGKAAQRSWTPAERWERRQPDPQLPGLPRSAANVSAQVASVRSGSVRRKVTPLVSSA